MLPLLIASIGSSSRTAVILASIVVTFKLVTFVIRGIQQTDPRLIDLAKIMNLPVRDQVGLMYLPSAVAIAGTGLRLSASRAFGTIIAAGLVAGTPGLGLDLLMAESAANYPRMFSYVIVMGFAGSAIYSIFTKLERKLVHWRVAV
jgi:ABC-type nitrate/sulfonate/bicarbonate transport system permease component